MSLNLNTLRYVYYEFPPPPIPKKTDKKIFFSYDPNDFNVKNLRGSSLQNKLVISNLSDTQVHN